MVTMWLAAVGAVGSVAFAADPAPPAAPAAPIVVSGTLSVDPAKASMVGQAKALFVSVRDPAGGPPLAALKLQPGPFPMTFQITEADAIAMAGVPRPFPAKVDLTVRLDADGDPLSKDDGMPAAVLPGTAKGSAGMKIPLK
ncbi:MAG: hypothetical protein ABMB14_20030 [Myxococcota bacterium]